MKMHNFSREFIQFHTKWKGSNDDREEELQKIISLLQRGYKFMLPYGGFVMEDKTLRALESKKLTLPFQTTILEFIDPWVFVGNQELDVKIILVLLQNEDLIGMRWMYNIPLDARWNIAGAHVIERDNFFDGTQLRYANVEDYTFTTKTRKIINEDIQGKLITIVTQFLNKLACNNVSIGKIPMSKTRLAMLAGKKNLAALPYDDYHQIVITPHKSVTNRDNFYPLIRPSPREHPRRGHIQRYWVDGILTLYWIDDIIVNPGEGGVITADYIVRK